MGKLINLEIFGRPVNLVIIILMIVVFWFAFYSVAGRVLTARFTPDETKG